MCMCVCVCLCKYVCASERMHVCHVNAGACEQQRMASNPPELEVQVLVNHLTWVLELNLGPL